MPFTGLKLAFTFIVTCFVTMAYAVDVAEYLPKDHRYNNEVSKPEEILGFGIGERHIRHDQLLEYMSKVANQSDRFQLTDIGRTNEYRKQILLTVSSAENIANLDNILASRSNDKIANPPLVVWLGYSIHGDEISGANAAMVIAYHLAASEEQAVKDLLENTIIVLEPSVNPDGMDRFVNWVSTHAGITDNSDPNHIEHHQGWRTGRTNHFGFDLNRDWLLLTQQESQNRVKYFHRYRPHVLGDFHEMGANGTYFFQPGIPSRTHPYTPANNVSLTQLLATYHASALDSEDRLYYSEESFDDFYYGKGSTYPDINGSVGVLFEQASSRGLQQDTVNGLLTFEYSIKNHVITSLSTIEGAWKNRQKFIENQQNFYQESLRLAEDEKSAGYLLSEEHDQYRLTRMLDTLKQHQINVYKLSSDFEVNDVIYKKEFSYFVPYNQKQYRLIKALFNQLTNFKDNTFYDVSGWTLPLALNISAKELRRKRGLKLHTTPWQEMSRDIADFDSNAYAYVFKWHEFMAPKLLNQLLQAGIKAKVATKTFSANVSGKKLNFSRGSILIPAGIQSSSNWRNTLNEAALSSDISLYALTTGLSSKGIDLGSGSFRSLSAPKVLMVGGKGVSQYESAGVLYYLDKLLGMPVTVVEQQRMPRIDLNSYSHIIMVDGRYNFSEATTNKLSTWVKSGGVIFSQKRAAKWLADRGILQANFASKEHIDQLFDTDNLSYRDKEKLSARKRIAGAIFDSSLDLSHPLAYGYTQKELPLFKNSALIMESSLMPFVTVAKYTKTPLLSGYTDSNLVNRIALNPALIAHNVGKGRVIASVNDLTFRGYFLGSMKLLANSLYFNKAFSAQAGLKKH